MTAKELAEMLLKYPDFEVKFSIFECDNSEYGASVRSWNIIDIGDVGHSSKIIQLEGREES